ncbi:hypothetical protein LEMLEM_LOCUS4039, partial [Lemmus lemmus]
TATLPPAREHRASAPTRVSRRGARLGAPSGHGSSRELAAACRDTEREKGSYRRDSVSAEADAARYLQPPPQARASLRPPPPPPSSAAAAAAAAGKGAEETASLPLPTAPARLGPNVRKSATSGRRVARAPDVMGATRRGRGYGGSQDSGRRLAEAAGAGLAGGRGTKPLGRGLRRPGRPTPPTSQPMLVSRLPARGPSRSPQAFQRPGLLFTQSPPDFLQFPGRHVGGRRCTESVSLSSPHFF